MTHVATNWSQITTTWHFSIPANFTSPSWLLSPILDCQIKLCLIMIVGTHLYSGLNNGLQCPLSFFSPFEALPLKFPLVLLVYYRMSTYWISVQVVGHQGDTVTRWAGNLTCGKEKLLLVFGSGFVRLQVSFLCAGSVFVEKSSSLCCYSVGWGLFFLFFTTSLDKCIGQWKGHFCVNVYSYDYRQITMLTVWSSEVKGWCSVYMHEFVSKC